MDETATQSLINYYDREMLGTYKTAFGKIGFHNYGYWKGVEHFGLEFAQINLIETLADFFVKRDGRVLDVACGIGASSKFLTKYFEPSNVVGVNISERQIALCKALAPEIDFRPMDATKLGFDDGSFENILCIEAAFHFSTRAKFLEEAHRILKPGGRLAMSDIIVPSCEALDEIAYFPRNSWPIENSLPDVDAYRAELFRIGFKYVRIDDTTDLSIKPAMKHFSRKLEEDTGALNPRATEFFMHIQKHGYVWPRGSTWCLVYAMKS